MIYKCLVFDHDDTVVNSTANIHHPSFLKYLAQYRPGRTCSLEKYFLRNFEPGFIPMCREDYDMTDADLDIEVRFWQEYVEEHIPAAYAGIREIMLRQKAEGGLICVASHSLEKNIRRDYAANDLPQPDLVFGWDLPMEQRKPNPFALEEIMRIYRLGPEELLMIDDLKPGYDMAVRCGVDFAAAGWANDIEEIERFMRRNSRYYFKTVEELDKFLR